MNKPLDPDLRPEKDKGLQKHVLAQPAKIIPTGPVATATGPAPPTPYLPRAIPQIKLPVKVVPPTPASPPTIPKTNTSNSTNTSTNKVKEFANSYSCNCAKDQNPTDICINTKNGYENYNTSQENPA